MKRALCIALAAACAQQQETVRKTEPAAGAIETSADAGVTSPGSEPHKPAAGGKPTMAQQPRPTDLQKLAGPQITKLPTGATLLELPATQNAVVNVQLRFRSGAIDDPRGKAGLTYLTARVMAEGGTKALSAKQLLEALFPLAAELDVRVDKEQTTFIARVHRDNLAKLIPIVTDVLVHPRWDPEEFRRLRDAAVNDVEKRLRQGDDENLGKESLGELMFRDHPYGRLTLGHASDLKSMSLQDLQQHAGRVFTADRLTIGISGGYPSNLGNDVAQALSSLPAKSQPAPAVPEADPRGPRFLLVEKNADSTAISIGMPWVLSRKDPDWAAMSIARSAFGEHRQFNGRLMQRLRERRGLNYGDYAYIEHFRQEGGDAATAQLGRVRHQQEFTIWLRPVRDDNRLFALRAALYELSRSLSEEPFSNEEVEQTKGFLDGYILLFDQTDARKLGYALDDQFYGMTAFLSGWRSSLRDLSAAQVNAAWRKWVDPHHLRVALAGKDMAAVKRTLLSGEATPIQYQRDASGKAPEKPAAQLAEDKQIERFPFGADGDADVEIVPVEKMFE
jgi:zinc protease